ncbi:MAG: response regulator [Armatimonadota bacterium]|nr:response regulator [Armatimonadota bacterium]
MPAARVLVADDSVNLCRVLCARLQQSGLQCIVVHDGVQALEIVRSQPVDVVVLDVRLPRKGGVEVLREIREDYPQLPCILITAFDDVSLHEEAVRLGANAVLQKPFDLEAFTDLVWREVWSVSPATGAHMLLQNGEKVIVDLRSGESSYAYASRVLWQDDRLLEVEPPVAALDMQALSKGVAIVQFARGDGVYQFRARVQLATTPRLALYLSKPISIRRLQRRRHQRVAEEGQVSLVFSPQGEREKAPLTLTGELYDLSRGGFSVLLPQAPPVGEEAAFHLTLSRANLTLTGQARVVCAGDVVVDRVPAVYRVGLEFTRLAPAMRQALSEWLEKTPARR